MRDQNNSAQFLRNLSTAAHQGQLSPVAGRREEIDQVLEILGQHRKANVLLIGPAGSGKTAIAEGLAMLTARYPESLPPALQDMQIKQLDTAALIAGAGVVGEHEKRIKGLFQSLGKKSILFIDEIHTLFGSGGREGQTDTAQQLKTYLARDDFKVIAATTADEYSRILAKDSAFSRRFQKVYIQPLSLVASITALVAYAQYRDRLVRRRLLKEIVRLASITCPTRALPDPAIDIFERALSIADWEHSSELTLRHVEKAMARTVGLPTSYKQILLKLSRSQDDKPLALAATNLLAMLQASSRQPFVLNCDSMTSERLAASLGDILRQGVLEIDGQRSERELYGAEPGYIGHGNRLAMHALLETPFKVVRISNGHSSATGRRLINDVERGWFQDTEGHQIPVSVAIIDTKPERRIGF
ncbi:AAA family ATPase [Candidatus Symbiobacter mobilis]|uniref:ATPase-like protein n=1 Tax=Candidatus Symbiobacter mobilis CR TaxID=946483 RepID=U5NAX1_9BURK|nr:AAA family ATPase [Candidatus Symbiobacter mobilis]AGX88726.1 ATPase-like protein [Candidatus Symbiobacter mobilis CR]